MLPEVDQVMTAKFVGRVIDMRFPKRKFTIHYQFPRIVSWSSRVCIMHRRAYAQAMQKTVLQSEAAFSPWDEKVCFLHERISMTATVIVI